MRKRSKTMIAVFSVLTIIGFCSVVHAAENTYHINRITGFAVHWDGRAFITWSNAPHNLCGGEENYGWVVIAPFPANSTDPNANTALREFAQHLFLNSLPAVIVTDGPCWELGLGAGQRLERVRTIYSLYDIVNK